MFFNSFSTKECIVDNDHDPDVNFYYDVSMLDTQWATPFFIHTGVWTTKFLKPIRPGKNDCSTHKPPGIES